MLSSSSDKLFIVTNFPSCASQSTDSTDSIDSNQSAGYGFARCSPVVVHGILPSPPTPLRSSTANKAFRCNSPTDSGRHRFQSPNDILKQKLRTKSEFILSSYFANLSESDEYKNFHDE